MDDMVRAALKKWPNVPACTGWLALDARGDWYMRDDRTQAAGAFPLAKGSRIEHRQLREFIERNYEGTPEGAWYFQNGPQRVYMQLEAAPWTWRVQDDFSILSHTGLTAEFSACWLDERDRLFITTPLGLGIVHSMDVHVAARAVEQGVWEPEQRSHEALLAEARVVLDPQPRA